MNVLANVTAASVTFSLAPCICSPESSDRSIPFEGPASDSGELGVRFGLRVGTGESEAAASGSGEELVVVPGGDVADRPAASSGLLSRL